MYYMYIMIGMENRKNNEYRVGPSATTSINLNIYIQFVWVQCNNNITYDTLWRVGR